MGEGRFLKLEEAAQVALDWGSLRPICDPVGTEWSGLLASEIVVPSGKGHNFHFHPRQEELIYVLSGEIEQWLGTERRILGPGDCVDVPAKQIHASFNESNEDAKLFAILVPPVGEGGYEFVDVSDQPPWDKLRG